MSSALQRRTMRLHHAFIALALIAALSACTAAQDKNPDTRPVREPAPAEVANPMASFARMAGGEWRLTAPGMMSLMLDTWHWGPGQHSMRVMTHGTNTADGNSPWRELQVFYWHPGRKQVCLLGLSPFARGVRACEEFD